MIISLIVAMDEKGGIGKNNQLPWHLPSDLKRFKKLTMGHTLVMGRKTYETIGRPLAGRIMVVITHQLDFHPIGCRVVHSLREALNFAEENNEDEVFIIGGGEIFQEAIDIADKIYLTNVYTDVDADVFFPKLDPIQWISRNEECSSQTIQDEYKHDFKILVRKH